MALFLGACGGGGDSETPQSLAALDDADANTGADGEASTDSDESTEADSASTSDEGTSDEGGSDEGGSDEATDAAPAQAPETTVVDNTIPDDFTVVTAPPAEATTTTAVSTDGVVFERIDPSPELPGMTIRPIIDVFIDPADDRLVRVHFGALFCDGFRTVIDETDTTVSVTLEGASTLGPDQGECDPELFATELATLLTAPLGDRELIAVQP